MTQTIFSGKFVPRRIMRQHGSDQHHGQDTARRPPPPSLALSTGLVDRPQCDHYGCRQLAGRGRLGSAVQRQGEPDDVHVGAGAVSTPAAPVSLVFAAMKRPSRSRRAAAAVALAALIAALLYLAISALHHWWVLLATVFSLGVAVMAAWYILSRRGVARAVATAVAALALLVFVIVVIASETISCSRSGSGWPRCRSALRATH